MTEGGNPDQQAAIRHYNEVLGPKALERVQDGESFDAIAEELLEYLRGHQYDLTDAEFEQVAGTGEDREERLRRLDTAVECIVREGTLIVHSPGELLRGYPHRFQKKTWLERLASGDPDEFGMIISELDEAVGR